MGVLFIVRTELMGATLPSPTFHLSHNPDEGALYVRYPLANRVASVSSPSLEPPLRAGSAIFDPPNGRRPRVAPHGEPPYHRSKTVHEGITDVSCFFLRGLALSVT